VTLEATGLAGARRRERLAFISPGLPSAVLAFAPVLGLAAAQGGFFPTAWGWASLPLLWVIAVALAVRQEVRLSVPERAFIGLTAAVGLWVAISAVWSVAPADSLLESQRSLLYLAGVTAVLVVARSRFVWEVLGGLVAAIAAICMFSLGTRLVPDRLGVHDSTAVYRLAQPIGYWNGLALFAGMGALLAFVFAVRARTLVARALCAAVLVILLPTMYFTFGRGAWLALAAGFAAAIAVDRRRLQLLVCALALGAAPALAVWLASRRPGLTHLGVSLASEEHDGHRLAALIVVLAVANAVCALALAYAERRVEPGLIVRRGFAAAVVLVSVVALGTVFVRYGGPVRLVQRGYDAFKAPPPHAVNLNRRLLSFSGNGRAELWRLAWDDSRQHPLLGAGAGTYERYFLRHQPPDVSRVRDAHGLYLETLAELGPIGLALLVAALAVPLAVIGRARRHPLAPAALGAYVAYLVHTGVDWDWELPAVTLVGLLSGTSLLLAARRSFRSPPLSQSARWGGVVLAVVLSLAAVVGLVGNMALSRSNSARSHGDWVRAASQANTARSWMPWSPAPWEALGRAQLGAGLPADARRSFRKAISMDSGDWELWYRLAGASKSAERRHALAEAARLYPRAGLAQLASASRGTQP
jgi:O-antigen ligase/polysaccharide polymerase Wzy-like membrane protein